MPVSSWPLGLHGDGAPGVFDVVDADGHDQALRVRVKPRSRLMAVEQPSGTMRILKGSVLVETRSAVRSTCAETLDTRRPARG